jgi:hypothetical protein
MIKITPIIEIKPPNPVLFLDEIRKGLLQCGKLFQQDYREFLDTWENKPDVGIFTSTVRAYVLMVETKPVTDARGQQILRWVIYGTEAHDIPPRGDWPIHYPGTFTPKTQPGVIQSRGGGKSGAEVWWPRGQAVPHPGIEPRNTVQLIEDTRRDEVYDILYEATAKGIIRAYGGRR